MSASPPEPSSLEPDPAQLLETLQVRIAANRLSSTRRQQLQRLQQRLLKIRRPES